MYVVDFVKADDQNDLPPQEMTVLNNDNCPNHILIAERIEGGD